jgi:hypothetical protein
MTDWGRKYLVLSASTMGSNPYLYYGLYVHVLLS